MAVTSPYLAKIKRAVRIASAASEITAELTDTVEECRADLTRLGIPTAVVNDEDDVHILDAVKRYARWRFAMDASEALRCQAEYHEKADELRKSAGYGYADE